MIVICEGALCAVWQCEPGGCAGIGQYTKIARPSLAPQASEPTFQGQPAAFDQVCEGHGKQACAIKVCNGPTCSVSAFDGKRFVPVGKVDNIDYLIEHATK
jgi:hypothetical protein